MKRVCMLLLAVLLLLGGCSEAKHPKDVSADDVRCPYDISHQKNVVELSLCDAEKSDLNWQVQMIPEDICEVTQQASDKEYTSLYRIAGLQEGAAQLTFTAMQADETVVFVLSMIAHVDENKKVEVSTVEHRERIGSAVDEGGLNYQWSVDVNGLLHFSFINAEDIWSVRGDGEGVCILSNKMSTPSGCKFSAESCAAGQTEVKLIGEATQRTIYVTIMVDQDGKMEVISVQE